MTHVDWQSAWWLFSLYRWCRQHQPRVWQIQVVILNKMESIRNKSKKIRLYSSSFLTTVHLDTGKSNKGLYVYMFKVFFWRKSGIGKWHKFLMFKVNVNKHHMRFFFNKCTLIIINRKVSLFSQRAILQGFMILLILYNSAQLHSKN